ncbi:MAG TPA: 6-carboxytetrahydropterin synthase [Sedimentisphaerales bacterium]|nr:6-carboxytetrahydropterin synthase [Sedimentisphaerales bacterium]
MFRITVEKRFRASHGLRLPAGSRENLHSHDWLVRACVAADSLDAMGLVMDFEKLGRIMDDIIQPLAGSELEALRVFRDVNCSAENVAEYIFKAIEPRLDRRVRLDAVEVMESPGCLAKYSRD